MFGEHLVKWRDGLRLLEELSSIAEAAEVATSTLNHCKASLAVCAGIADRRSDMSASDAFRVTIMAAGSLCRYDHHRSANYMEDAATAANSLKNNDPAVRAVASGTNNIAGALQESKVLDAEGARLMIRAAELAHKYWERAGTWREVEGAEYRLAVCCVAAGAGSRCTRTRRALHGNCMIQWIGAT